MLYRCTEDRAEVAPALQHAVELALVASVAVVLLATLAPFDFAVPARLRVDVRLRLSDVLLNLVLLAPLGVLLGMRGLRLGRTVLSPFTQAFVIGAAFSAAVELLQLFVPVRCPSPVDVLANALGCALGCVFQARHSQRIERLLVRFLASAPSLGQIMLLALALALIALAPLRGPQGFVIGLMASLGLAAWLGFALRAHARSALVATAYALPVVGLLELCRGSNTLHVASLSTLALAAACALVSAHAAGRVQFAKAPARRVWV